jgi:hypothetical protein
MSCPGAAERLRQREREQFLREWPEIRARMARLGLQPPIFWLRCLVKNL